MNLQMNKQKVLKLLFYLVIGLVIFFLAFSFIDPDFGWHLVTGNLILKSGFPKTDPFSYTMPSFPFIEPEWLTDIVFAKLYPVVGLPGIAALFSILFLSAVYISVSKFKKLKEAFFIVGISSLIPFFTTSPKVFSWLLFAVFSFVVLSDNFWKKYWYLIPAMVILWANTHGSFPEALIILGIIVVCKSFRERHIWWKGVLVTVLSCLATLVNPYGLKDWWIVWLTISDRFLKSRIAEFQPTYINPLGFSFLAVFLLTISIIFISRYRRRFKIEEIIINLAFFIQAILAIRNITYWVFIDLPMAALAINYFFDEIKGIKGEEKRFLAISKWALLFVSAAFTLEFVAMICNTAIFPKIGSFYPDGAISYLETHNPQGQIFSEYNWGGYLIWKLPQRKVFIYGAAPLFRWQANIPGESNYAMTDYINIITDEIPYKPEFDKYNIDTVLLSAPKENNQTTRFIDEMKYVLGTGPGASTQGLYPKLVKDGWKKVYQDTSSVILKNPI